MPNELSEVYQQAQNDVLQKRYESALAGFANVIQTDPDHLWSRFMVGSTFEAMKSHNRAYEVYKSLAWHCIKAGYPLLGLAATKRVRRWLSRRGSATISI